MEIRRGEMGKDGSISHPPTGLRQFFLNEETCWISDRVLDSRRKRHWMVSCAIERRHRLAPCPVGTGGQAPIPPPRPASPGQQRLRTLRKSDQTTPTS